METLTDQTVIDRLFDRINYERQTPIAAGDFKLSNMIRLLECLGNPQLKRPVIHVAGTKGKGSVCAIVAAILEAAGYRAGIYSSPHLERVNQRIVFGGAEISDTQLINVLKEIEPAVQQIDEIADQQGSKRLTFFEVITTAAFQFFATHPIDVVILEVGMGGRLDSTNLCQPEICVITNISLDHTRQLGSTVDKIAAEKAGIIKPGVPVISGVRDPLAREVIRQVASEKNAPLTELDEDFELRQSDSDVNRFSCFGMENLSCNLIGQHQQVNAAIAIAACRQLAQSDSWTIAEPVVRQGLASATLPGRCELVSLQPGNPGSRTQNGAAPAATAKSPVLHVLSVLLDMAHNEASSAALAETLSQLPERKTAQKRIMIFAATRDKDIEAMLRPLVGLFDHIIFTKYQENPRGRLATELREIAEQVFSAQGTPESRPDVTIADSPQTAWAQALESCESELFICITGSAFLVAELRPTVRELSG